MKKLLAAMLLVAITVAGCSGEKKAAKPAEKPAEKAATDAPKAP